LVFSHYGDTKKWEVSNFHGFLKIEHDHKKNPYCIPFTEEVLNMVAGHKVYSFLDGFLGYH
jgi:hypothetical protein